MLMDQFIPSITHFKSSMIITYSIVISVGLVGYDEISII